MRFPSEALVPSGGEIYCHLFENPHTGLARNLFWSITIDFAPLRYGEEEFECSMTCEWIAWSVRSWRDLDDRRLDVAYGEEGIESSFYMTAHDIANRTSLSLCHRGGDRFRVSMRMEVDFHGYYGGDADPAMLIYAEADLPFTGLIVVPENLFPKPLSSEQVKGIASQFVELADFSEPQRRDRDFLLRPAI
jgi:hypothetical protein